MSDLFNRNSKGIKGNMADLRNRNSRSIHVAETLAALTWNLHEIPEINGKINARSLM